MYRCSSAVCPDPMNSHTQMGGNHLNKKRDEIETKRLDTSFKLLVVRMIRMQGLGVVEVCRDMKLGETAVRRWVAQV